MINDLIKNKGENEDECLAVLGDLNSLNAIANFWDSHADLLHLIGINEFIEWTNDNEFDSDQVKAFQDGLSAFPKFAEKCFINAKEREKLLNAPKSGKAQE